MKRSKRLEDRDPGDLADIIFRLEESIAAKKHELKIVRRAADEYEARAIACDNLLQIVRSLLRNFVALHNESVERIHDLEYLVYGEDLESPAETMDVNIGLHWPVNNDNLVALQIQVSALLTRLQAFHEMVDDKDDNEVEPFDPADE